jgi:ribonucleoside-diphosphate reductase alpha chain
MATSIRGYLLRELAISYLDRGDLAHAQPADLMPDTVGKGEAESNLMRRATSNGFVRNKLTVFDGGVGRATALAPLTDPDIDGPSPSPQCRPRTSASNASAPPA